MDFCRAFCGFDHRLRPCQAKVLPARQFCLGEIRYACYVLMAVLQKAVNEEFLEFFFSSSAEQQTRYVLENL